MYVFRDDHDEVGKGCGQEAGLCGRRSEENYCTRDKHREQQQWWCCAPVKQTESKEDASNQVDRVAPGISTGLMLDAGTPRHMMNEISADLTRAYAVF